MKTNQLHQTIITEDDMMDVIYSGAELSHLVVDDTAWVKQFKKTCDTFDLPVNIDWEIESKLSENDYVTECLNDWALPDNYVDFDITSFLYEQCNTTEQRLRVESELKEFGRRGMMLVLQWLKYFVDTLRENDMVWGVGRGSSVASYVLFLLGVHRVDSLKYNLDIKEFLK